MFSTSSVVLLSVASRTAHLLPPPEASACVWLQEAKALISAVHARGFQQTNKDPAEQSGAGRETRPWIIPGRGCRTADIRTAVIWQNAAADFDRTTGEPAGLQPEHGAQEDKPSTHSPDLRDRRVPTPVGGVPSENAPPLNGPEDSSRPAVTRSEGGSIRSEVNQSSSPHQNQRRVLSHQWPGVITVEINM